MPKVLPITVASFEKKAPRLEEIARDWVETECADFDALVKKAQGFSTDTSIWDMPEIDSKAVTSLLVLLEKELGIKLPSSLIKRGGYEGADQLVETLFAKIREMCIQPAVGDGPSVSAI